MCDGVEENQPHRGDPYDPRVQEQPLFLVCSSITILTHGLSPTEVKIVMLEQTKNIGCS